MNSTLALAPVLLIAGIAGSTWLTSESQPTAADFEPAPISAAAYKVDSGHSFVMFRVNHLGLGMAYGQFRKISGDFVYNAEDISKSSISLLIDPASIDTNSADRDKHLRNSDFFSVKEFPDITFKSTKITAVGEKGKFEIEGTLNAHGVEKTIHANGTVVGAGTDPWGNQRAGFEVEFQFNRIEFGINYMPDGLGKEVDVVVAIEGVQAKG